MKNNFQWVFINYAPNTEYICKKKGYVIMNVDNSGVCLQLKEQAFTEYITDNKIKEKVLAILN